MSTPIYSAQTLFALGPYVALTAGILLLLLIEVLPALGLLRKPVFLASIAAAGWYAWRMMGAEELWVFERTYVANTTTAWWTMLFLASTVIAWFFGQRFYLQQEERLVGEHDILMLTATSGMVLMAGSRDLLVFFVGLELLSVPLYTLSGFQRAQEKSVEAGLKYFLLGAFAAATYLFGSALVYAGTGTLTFARMHPVLLQGPLVVAGAALIAASLFFKVSVFPFHLWVPDVYQGAPSPVTTFMAMGTKAAAFAFLLPAAVMLPPSATPLLAIIAVLTMAAGNFAALVQTDLKRLLAYSAIAHAGTVLLAVAGMRGNPQAFGTTQAVLFYMAAYVFTAGGAFGIVTLLEGQTGAPVTIDSVRGLAKRRPGLAAALALFMLSLGGIPATGGFLGKYLVFSVAVRSGLVVAAVIGILLSVVALGYYLRVVVAMYMQPGTEGTEVLARPRTGAAWMALVCAAMVVVLGILPGWFLAHLH
jgi:NADH-quinone oxidoreductase subunit N